MSAHAVGALLSGSADNWNFNSSNPCLHFGGNYNQNGNHGLFYVNYNSTSNSNANIGCRLVVADFVSLALPLAARLTHCVAPPLPSKPAVLGFRWRGREMRERDVRTMGMATHLHTRLNKEGRGADILGTPWCR